MICCQCGAANPEERNFCGNCGTQLTSDGPASARTETFASPREELTTGSVFAGRYQIIEELGHGGMGRVYKALDQEINAKVAVKLIKPEIASHPKTLQRFRNELKIARDVSHKNVCRMYDLNKDEETYFITMEYVPGEDLKSFMHRSGQLSVGTAVRIAKQICDGLREAHKLGVVHRDLKSNNIMIDKDGDVRIMDFGIARSLSERGITGAGVMIGTPEYMSPEQVDGRDVDQRSDIYSLGVILYEMVTGRVPFEGDSPFVIGMKHKSERPEDPKALNAEVSDDVSRVILKCLEKDRDKRYRSADELLSELDNIAEGMPTTSKIVPRRKLSTSREVTVSFDPKKLWIPAIAVLALAVVSFVFYRGWPGRGSRLDPNLVMVAPFENQTGDRSLDPLGRMASDWITQGLSQTDIAGVVPTMTVLQYAPGPSSESGPSPSTVQPVALARAVGAGIVVSGVYYLADEHLQFHIGLTDARTGKLIHSLKPVQGTVDEKMNLIQILRSDIIGSLALYRDKSLSASYLRQAVIPSYEAYREFMSGYGFIGVDYAAAVRHFERASKLEPSWILPKLLMSTAYSNRGYYAEAASITRSIDQNRDDLSPWEKHLLDWQTASLNGKNEEALRFIRLAERLSPSLTTTYVYGLSAMECNRPRETVEAFAGFDSVDPEVLYRRENSWWAIRVWAQAHYMLGNHKQALKVTRRGRIHFPDTMGLRVAEVRALAALGRTKDVRSVIEESLNMTTAETSPGAVMLEASAELRVRGFGEQALEIAGMAVDWYSRHMGEADYRYSLALSLYWAERWPESRRLVEELSAETPENIHYRGFLGTLAARLGDEEEALGISEELGTVDRPYLFGSHTYWRARIASLLGDKQQAVKLLTEAFNQGRGYGAYLHNDMDLEPLRDDPPFRELIKPKG